MNKKVERQYDHFILLPAKKNNFGKIAFAAAERVLWELFYRNVISSSISTGYHLKLSGKRKKNSLLSPHHADRIEEPGTAVMLFLMKHSVLVKGQSNNMDLTELLPSQGQTEAHSGG